MGVELSIGFRKGLDMKKISIVLGLVCVVCFVPCAFSDSISFSGTVLQQGTGFGNVLNLLTLQQKGNATNETGAVVPTSLATGDASPTSKTYTVSQLTAAGVTAANFGLVFNPNETGAGAPDTVDVQSFFVDFYTSGNLVTPYLSVPLLGLPVNIVPISTGQGSQGWGINYTNTGDLTTFFGTGTNVIGAHGSIFNTDDGPDDFNIVQLATTSVPEPTTLLLLGFALVGLAGVRTLKK